MLKFIFMAIGAYLLIFGPLPELFAYSNQVLGLIVIAAGLAISRYAGNG